MIIFDSTFLVVLLQRNPPVAMDRKNKPVSKFKERVEKLVASMDVSNSIIGVPAPAMAEILVRAGRGRAQYITTLQDTWRFQILPFDSRAAIEAGDLIEKIKSSKEKWETWAKVKFDIQITAIAKAEDATLIYADDTDIEKYAKRFNIPVMRICDLPDPTPEVVEQVIEDGPSGTQGTLALTPVTTENPTTVQTEGGIGADKLAKPDKEANANNQLQADPPHPPAVQGSDGGRIEGEATQEKISGEQKKP